MGNYKQVNEIKVGNLTTRLPSSGKYKVLNDAVEFATAADGAHDIEDNLIYSVPAGKTFRCLGIRCFIGAAVGGTSLTITEGDTENAETTSKIIFPLVGAIGHWSEFYTDITFAATKFITYKPSGANVNHIQFIGYEF